MPKDKHVMTKADPEHIKYYTHDTIKSLPPPSFKLDFVSVRRGLHSKRVDYCIVLYCNYLLFFKTKRVLNWYFYL